MMTSKGLEDKKTAPTFEDVQQYLGGFGPYQRRLFILLCLPVMSIAVQTLMSVFSMNIPKHRCAVPELGPNDTFQEQNEAHSQILNLSIPWTTDDDDLPMRSKCLLYRNRNQTMAEVLLANRSSVSCREWVFDHTTFSMTFTEEEGLVCDKKGYRAYSDMLFMVGKLVGSFIVGIFSDFFGRKASLMVSLIIHIGCAVGLPFVTNFYLFTALRFLLGGANFGIFISLYALGLEMVSARGRTVASQVLQMLWCVGLFIQAGVAYGLRDWRHLQLVLGAPTVLFLSYFWLVNESPRWLASKGRYEEANEVLSKIAKKNGKPPPPKIKQGPQQEETVKRESCLRMFTNMTTLSRTLILFLNWIVVTMIYYGISLNVGNIGGNIFLNFFLSALAEMIGYFIAMLGLDRLGRKPMHCGSMIVGGLACVCSMFPVLYGNKSANWAIVFLSNVGKMGASSAFSIIYLFSAELYPTVARNSLMGTSSMIARVGGVIAPYIAQLNVIVGGDLGIALPLVVFGGSALLAGFLALLLPETLNKPLPETIADARNYGKQISVQIQFTYTFDSQNRLWPMLSAWATGGSGSQRPPNLRGKEVYTNNGYEHEVKVE